MRKYAVRVGREVQYEAKMPAEPVRGEAVRREPVRREPVRREAATRGREVNKVPILSPARSSAMATYHVHEYDNRAFVRFDWIVVCCVLPIWAAAGVVIRHWHDVQKSKPGWLTEQTIFEKPHRTN